MRKGLLSPLILGIVGVAILVALGQWQLQRLAWKEGLLAQIDARIAADPVGLPDDPQEDADKYLPVEMTGRIEDAALRVLVSHKQVGAGYRLISPFETDGRRVMLDRGIIGVGRSLPAAPQAPVQVLGNLHWPDDRLGSTPENDIDGNIWFARDIGPMAEALGTEPVLVIARQIMPAEPDVMTLPVDTSGIPNDHLNYAITWFSLAILWAAMTLLFIWRRYKGSRDT